MNKLHTLMYVQRDTSIAITIKNIQRTGKIEETDCETVILKKKCCVKPAWLGTEAIILEAS